MKSWTVFGFMTCVVVSVEAAPRSRSPQKQELPMMMSVAGQCRKLVVQGNDYTSVCGDKALGTSYRNGRSGFYFITTNGATLTFSGMGSSQIKPNPDRAIQPIDLVIFGYQGQHDRLQAVGHCDFENPYKGPSRIVCQARTEPGTYEVDFLSDGRPPR